MTNLRKYDFYLVGLRLILWGYDFSSIVNKDPEFDDLDCADKEYQNKTNFVCTISNDNHSLHLTFQEGGDLDEAIEDEIKLLNERGILVPKNADFKCYDPTYQNDMERDEWTFYRWNGFLLNQEIKKYHPYANVRVHHYDGAHVEIHVAGRIESKDFIPSYLATFMRHMENNYETGANK